LFQLPPTRATHEKKAQTEAAAIPYEIVEE